MYLDEDEVVIMRDAMVSDSKVGTVTLTLTNKHVIQTYERGFFNPEKVVNRYSLLDLRENNGKPNVLIGKTSAGKARLELYFLQQTKYYTFQSVFAEKKWANAIIKEYKACLAQYKKNQKNQNEKKATINVGAILSPIKDTIDSAKSAIIEKQKDHNTRVVKCPRCGEELVGEKGTEVTCIYCNTTIKIK